MLNVEDVDELSSRFVGARHGPTGIQQVGRRIEGVAIIAIGKRINNDGVAQGTQIGAAVGDVIKADSVEAGHAGPTRHGVEPGHRRHGLEVAKASVGQAVVKQGNVVARFVEGIPRQQIVVRGKN